MACPLPTKLDLGGTFCRHARFALLEQFGTRNTRRFAAHAHAHFALGGTGTLPACRSLGLPAGRCLPHSQIFPSLLGRRRGGSVPMMSDIVFYTTHTPERTERDHASPHHPQTLPGLPARYTATTTTCHTHTHLVSPTTGIYIILGKGGISFSG